MAWTNIEITDPAPDTGDQAAFKTKLDAVLATIESSINTIGGISDNWDDDVVNGIQADIVALQAETGSLQAQYNNVYAVASMDLAAFTTAATAIETALTNTGVLTDSGRVDMTMHRDDTTINSGDGLARIGIYGIDNTTNHPGGYLQFNAAETWVDGSSYGTDFGVFLTKSGDTSPTEILSITDAGAVGIGVTSPGAGIHLTMNDDMGAYSMRIAGSYSGNDIIRADTVTMTPNANTTYGYRFSHDLDLDANRTVHNAIQLRPVLENSGNLTTLRGLNVGFTLDTSYTGTLTNYYGVDVDDPTDNSASGVITNYTGIIIRDPAEPTGTIYGLQSSIASGANTWNLYISGSADNYMNGNLGIGDTTPASELTVAGDIESTGSANGVILESPDASRWRITVDNSGTLSTASI